MAVIGFDRQSQGVFSVTRRYYCPVTIPTKKNKKGKPSHLKSLIYIYVFPNSNVILILYLKS